MAGIDITLDAREVVALTDAWRRAPKIVADHLGAAIWEASLLLQREIQERTPVGAHGLLRGSIAAREPRVTGDRIEGEVGTALRYAIPVELGTRPHRPPVEPLIDWARARLGLSGKDAERAAWAIARKIEREGTAGAGMFSGALEESAGAVERIVRAGVARALDALARGVS